jgi:hypothetical protein
MKEKNFEPKKIKINAPVEFVFTEKQINFIFQKISEEVQGLISKELTDKYKEEIEILQNSLRKTE